MSIKHTILCIDDEPDNVDALERLFRKRYTILKALSAEEGLRILKTENPALIISDQRMPNMTGVEFFARSMKTHPETIRILLTGYTDIESVIGAINSGQVYRYVTKPWDPVDFTNTVDKAIERYELTAELKEKNAALTKALNELRTLDQAKTQFMMLINHELKTPLTVILSFLELMEELPLANEAKKYLDRISASAQRLKVLISDSLELVQAEAGALKVKATRTSTGELLKSNKNWEAQLSERSLHLEIDDENIKFKADQTILMNVLNRLMDNAAKFAKEKTTVRLNARSVIEGVEFEIINSGKTISKEKIEKILQPFNLDENALHHSRGTGLGLSICQALLKCHGSALRVECPSGEFRASFIIPMD